MATGMATGIALASPAWAVDPANWEQVEADARGQTVYFNAWGGAQNINDYIAWAGAVVKERYGFDVVHVKLDDTANAVAKVVAEK
ncbi:MAG: ABC transporter substrate-binding protein, partial [Nitratireductor sp.]|nr:ABC transporter substrate-binding protein [Nitratireductor sp.]